MNPMPAEARDPETYAVIGAGMEVHREMGCGFLEHVYHDSLAIEFEERGIPFQRQVELCVYYKGRALDCTYRADFICYGSIIVEIKAIKTLTGVDRDQVINYLKATRLHRAILLNFGASSLEYERIVREYH